MRGFGLRASGFGLLFVGCLPDDVGEGGVPTDDTAGEADADTDADADADADADPTGSIVGDWVSEGEDISDLFADEPFSLVRIDATFEADGTYRVDVENADGANASFAGTYVTGTSTTPATITLTQTVPSNATATGIYEVDGDTMTYEVVQTVPDYGYTPPTPESGFGTTGGPDMTAGINVQIYVRD
ncbi:MAG: hypothetical protein ACOZNI_24990 [Myxococcota bacterium]